MGKMFECSIGQINQDSCVIVQFDIWELKNSLQNNITPNSVSLY